MTHPELLAILTEADARPRHGDVLWELRSTGVLGRSNRQAYDRARAAVLRYVTGLPGPAFLQIDEDELDGFQAAATWSHPQPGTFQLPPDVDFERLERSALHTGDYVIYSAAQPVASYFWGIDWWKTAPDRVVDAWSSRGISSCVLPFTDDIEWLVFLSSSHADVAR